MLYDYQTYKLSIENPDNQLVIRCCKHRAIRLRTFIYDSDGRFSRIERAGFDTADAVRRPDPSTPLGMTGCTPLGMTGCTPLGMTGCTPLGMTKGTLPGPMCARGRDDWSVCHCEEHSDEAISCVTFEIATSRWRQSGLAMTTARRRTSTNTVKQPMSTVPGAIQDEVDGWLCVVDRSGGL